MLVLIAGSEKSMAEVEANAVKEDKDSQVELEKEAIVKDMVCSPAISSFGLRSFIGGAKKQHPWWQIFGIRSLHETEVWWSKFNGMMPFFVVSSEKSTNTRRLVEMEPDVD